MSRNVRNKAGWLLAALMLALAGPLYADSQTSSLQVTATVLPVCSVLTPENLSAVKDWDARLRLWEARILCSEGQHYLVSLKQVGMTPSFQPSLDVSTDLNVTSVNGAGTGTWQPLLDVGKYLSTSGSQGETLQLTLTY